MTPVRKIADAVLRAIGTRTEPHEFAGDRLVRVVPACPCADCVAERVRRRKEEPI